MNQHATWGCMQNASNSNSTTIWNSYLLFLKTIWDIVEMHKNREMKSLIRIVMCLGTYQAAVVEQKRWLQQQCGQWRWKSHIKYLVLNLIHRNWRVSERWCIFSTLSELQIAYTNSKNMYIPNLWKGIFFFFSLKCSKEVIPQNVPWSPNITSCFKTQQPICTFVRMYGCINGYLLCSKSSK